MAELKIVYLDPNELTPYENNTRKHAPSDIESIKKSIEQDGFNDPIGIWGENNIIVEGHGRQIAAVEMGLKKVPCIRLDHLTDTQRREYAIRHNRTAELSAWDFTALEEELAALDINGIDMSDLKFDFKSEFGEDEPPAPNTESSFHYAEQYAVTVLVKDEAEQREVYERLTAEGYECKVVCV